jgi:D-glycero-D-manno-heptose 1,7-bisphosphate phosphatase
LKLIILDRDGVINYDSPNYIKSVEEFQLIPGSVEALAQLKQAGFTIAVATSQSGIGRGFYDIATLNAMHAKLQNALLAIGGHIDYFAICPHHPDEQCACRKPKPGLFYQVANYFQCDITGVTAIGDSERDVLAAQAAGASPIVVLTGNGEKTRAALGKQTAIPIYQDLAAAVRAIVI